MYHTGTRRFFVFSADCHWGFSSRIQENIKYQSQLSSFLLSATTSVKGKPDSHACGLTSYFLNMIKPPREDPKRTRWYQVWWSQATSRPGRISLESVRAFSAKCLTRYQVTRVREKRMCVYAGIRNSIPVCLSLLWLFPQAGWVMHIPLMFICLQNTPELTVLCEKQLSLHTVQARCNYSINGSTNRSNISKFRKSCHCSWPPFLIHSIESSGRRCSWWRHGDKDNITLVCLGFLGLTSACCAWMNFR